MTAKKDLKRRVRERQAKTGESYTAARAHIVSARRQDEGEIEDADAGDAGDEEAEIEDAGAENSTEHATEHATPEHATAEHAIAEHATADGEIENAGVEDVGAEHATAERSTAEHATAEYATAHVTAEHATGEPASDPMKEPPFSVVELVNATDDAAKLGFKCHVLVSPTLARRLTPTRMLEKLRDALLATENDPAMELLRGLVFRGQRRPVGRDRLLGYWEDMRRFFVRAAAGIGGLTPMGDLLAFNVDGVMVVAQAGYVPDMPLPWTSRADVPHRLFLTEPDAHRVGSATLVMPR